MSGDRRQSPAEPEDGPDPVIAEVAITEAAVSEAADHHRPVTPDDLFLYRQEYYDRERRARRTDRQLGFLFLLTIVLFFVLAFRVEINDDKLGRGFYNACMARVATANQYNIGREALVQMVITAPDAPTDPSQLAAMAKQLRDGLLLPIEDCGTAPR